VIGEIYYGIGYVMMLFVIERHLFKKYLLSEAVDSAIPTEELHNADIDSQNAGCSYSYILERE